MINEDDLNKAHDETLNGINSSLFPLIFDLSLKDYTKENFERLSEIVRIAEVLIKFSSLMVQVYWLKITSLNILNDIEYNISQELDHILNQIWAGHLKHTSGSSNSILQHTAALPQTSILGRSVLNPYIFIKWRKLISLKDSYYKRFEYELNEGSVPNDFVLLIQSLPILKRIRFQKGKLTLTDFDNCEIDPFPFIKFFSDYKNPLYLYEIKQKNHEVVLSYEEPYDSEVFEYLISQNQNPSENEKFLWIRKIKGFEDVKNVQESIVYLFESGYKHIFNIANAIISKTGNRASIKKYLIDLKDTYKEIDPEQYPLDFLTLVLADLGPLHVLRQILGKNEEFLQDYLDYFENKGYKSKQYWIDQMQLYIDDKTNRYRDLIGMDDRMLNGIIKDQINADASIWCMLKAAGTIVQTNEGIIDPISRRLHVLYTYKKDKSGNNNNLIEANKIFERTYKFLIIFYTAISKMHFSIKDKEDSSEFIDVDYLLNELFGELEEKYKEICRMSFGSLMKTFREEFVNCHKGSIEYEAMKRFFGHNINDLVMKNRSHYEKIDNIATNWIKHDIIVDKCKKEKTEELFENAIQLFTFLQYGDFNIHDSEEYTLTPIYPMVISFREAHRNREGMNVYHYEILSFDTNSSKTQNPQNSIKILTEQKYYQNENYYCIPNTNKSSKQWWIDPFLIQCSKFDDLFNSLRVKYKS